MNSLGLGGVWRGGTESLVRVVGVALMAALLTSCASLTKNSSDEDKRKAVTASAAERWQLIIKGDSGVAYDAFMSTGSRQVISRNEFMERMRVTQFRTAAVQGVECAVESCKTDVRITYDHKLMKGVGITLHETWIIEDGRVRFVWQP